MSMYILKIISLLGGLALFLFGMDVMADSSCYLSIYFAGVSGILFYNIGSGILRAVGDSRRPLAFLVLSA